MGEATAPIEVVAVSSDQQLRDVRDLFDEYWRAFAFDPCFQSFADEIAALPGDYASPMGRLALAVERDGVDADRIAGCIALRPLSKQRCEMKRLYVRDAFRGCGAGRALVEWLLEQARAIGYTEMYLDTMPSMNHAIALYERFGFVRCGSYSTEPTAGALCFRLSL